MLSGIIRDIYSAFMPSGFTRADVRTSWGEPEPHLFPIGACTLDVPVMTLARLENGLGTEKNLGGFLKTCDTH